MTLVRLFKGTCGICKKSKPRCARIGVLLGTNVFKDKEYRYMDACQDCRKTVRYVSHPMHKASHK